MKNACVIFKNKSSMTGENAFFSLLDTFRLKGYDFEEIHILPLNNPLQTEKTLANVSDCENVLFLTEKINLSIAKEYLQRTFPQAIYGGGVSGTGVYTSNKTNCFLLTVDEAKTGSTVAKEVCIPYLEKVVSSRYGRYVIRAVGANKTYVEQILSEAERMGGAKIFYRHTNRYAEDIIEIFYEHTIPKNIIDEVIRLLVDGLGESIYALEDVTLEEQLVRLLKLRGKKLSVAESFTGGGIGYKIVSVAGASSVYFEGINVYDEQSKIQRLNVSKTTLQLQGAVSDQTAYEMATGLIATGNCDICIATTGLAGPKTDRSLLPVGLCYIAVGTKEKVLVYRYQFWGDREEITQTAIQYALFLAYKQLKDL